MGKVGSGLSEIFDSVAKYLDAVAFLRVRFPTSAVTLFE
jgi:hypothetical protein